MRKNGSVWLILVARDEASELRWCARMRQFYGCKEFGIGAKAAMNFDHRGELGGGEAEGEKEKEATLAWAKMMKQGASEISRHDSSYSCVPRRQLHAYASEGGGGGRRIDGKQLRCCTVATDSATSPVLISQIRVET